MEDRMQEIIDFIAKLKEKSETSGEYHVLDEVEAKIIEILDEENL